MKYPRKLIGGVGVNDADYITSKYKDAKLLWRCPFYSVWLNMIQRCYVRSDKCYRGVATVCNEWLTFSNFKNWMTAQDWEGKFLDKDLKILGSKEYSPATCLFVSREVNNFILRREACRGELPIGVCRVKGSTKFMAQIRNQLTKQNEYLGLHETPSRALAEYLKRKIQICLEVIESESSDGVKMALCKYLNKLIFGQLENFQEDV